MASRAERREEQRIEAIIKLAALGVAGLAFLVGGVSGFAHALHTIVLMTVVLAVMGVGAYLVLKSRLVARKKAGILALLGSGLVFWFWINARAPQPWRMETAVVTSIDGLTITTETDFTYRPKGINGDFEFTATEVKSWQKVSSAAGYRPGPATVFYNPANPRESSFERTNGWNRTTASPGTTRLKVSGTGSATLRVGSLFDSITTTATGPRVAAWTEGTQMPVWINPATRTDLSFEPRSTPGSEEHWPAVLGGLLALVGVAALVRGPQWLEVLPTQSAREPTDRQNNHLPDCARVSIADRLRAIDWFQFEGVAARILESEGWEVQRTGGAKPDGGADLMATREGRRAVVQCKHWRRFSVQPRIIRELIGTKASAQFAADEAILFTLSDCTGAALNCARENSVAIYDALAIEIAIERIGLEQFPALLAPDNKTCPKCGAAMVLRTKVENPFWGCSTYPRCRATIERA